MAKDKGAGKDNVVAIAATVCCVEKCGKKGDRLNFCPEHYAWFKEGLVNKQGKRPVDFDKKYQAYLHRTKTAA
jgi:hypothetical protein